MGRFLSEDPIGFSAGDENLYRYVHNASVLFNDPFGLKVCFNQSDGGYHHRWVQIGDDPGDSFGFNPDYRSTIDLFGNTIPFPYGNPGVVNNPDTGVGNTTSSCVDTTITQEEALKKHIRDNYNINNDPKSNIRNPNYDYGFNDCRHFVDDIKNQLEQIKKTPSP